MMPCLRFLFALLLIGLAGCSTSGSGSPAADTLSVSDPTLALAGGGAPGSLKVVTDLPPPSGTSNGAEALLSAGDTLTVEVFRVPDLTRTVQIDASGTIGLPLIGNVQAANKTVRQLTSEIERLYGASYLQSPQVTVLVKDSIGQRVTIDGEVSKPGIYPVAAGSTLLQALAQAGGFKPNADPKKIYVFRDIGGRKLVANYDVGEIRSGKKRDPRIYGGDTVISFTSQSKVAMQNLKEALGLVRLVPMGL